LSPTLAERPAATVAAPPASSGVGVGVDQLADIVAGLARVPALWASYPVHDPIDRGKVRLLATDQYEVWLLGWCPGQHVELHDHGRSDAAFQVVQGDLIEVRSEPRGLRHHPLRAGHVRLAPRGTVHDVVNAGDAVATSIHAYSPPLTTMNFYPEGAFGPSRAEPVAETPARYDAARLARRLHPARRA
jgi:predicted metal-dependent enzyme (double-stranded beta helix superfamily)